MEHLSVKQVAELKNCSERYIQRICKEGKLKAEIIFDSTINQERYAIPISALPEYLKAKHYAKLRAEAGLMPELKAEKTAKKQHLKQPQRTFDELGDDEREIVTFWTGVIDEWQRLRAAYSSKAAFDEMYVSKFRLENPDVRISVDILYRKWKAIREKDIEALLDKRGAWKRCQSSIPEQAWNAFLWYWLDENKPTVSLCYRSMKLWVTDFYPELLEDIPSERAFRRRIESDVSYALKTYMRDGEKAFHDRCMPYIMRMYDDLAPNDCWIADNHTFDIISNDGESNHRLYLTAFLDAKSGVLTGWNITDSPDSQSTILALRHGIKRFGIPKCIYVDNGREFLTFDLGGNGNRVRKSTKNAPNPTTIFKRLGIEMRNAIVRNAQAKPIERTFCTVKNQFSKLWSGFCGGTILEKPESLKRRIKNGQLPRDYEIRDVLEDWIDGEYNCQEYGGSERKYKGMSRIDVWSEAITEVRKATDDVLNLLMMRSTRKQQIKRNGVHITVCGEQIWYIDPKQALMNLKKEVFVRYDPADLRTVRIYDAEDEKFLFEWGVADILLADYLEEEQQNIAEPQQLIRASKKFIREQAVGVAENLTNEQRITLLDTTIRKAHEARENNFVIRMPSRIIPLIVHEDVADARKAVGAEEIKVPIDLKLIQSNAAKRKGE